MIYKILSDILYKKSWIIKIVIIVVINLSLFCSGSCKSDNIKSNTDIKDALKISTWVLDESVEGNDYYVVDETTGKTVDNENAVYTLEKLKENEVKKMAPMGYDNMSNLNFLIEYDGMIEIVSDGGFMQLAYDKDNMTTPVSGNPDMIASFDTIKTAYQIYLNVCPLDDSHAGRGMTGTILLEAEVGKEYYINVNAYRLANQNTPIIKARLKLTVLEDEIPLKRTIFSPVGKNSRFLSVELVSYNFGDKYRFYDESFVEED